MSYNVAKRDTAGRDSGIEREGSDFTAFTLDGTGWGGITSETLSPSVPPSVPRKFPLRGAPNPDATFHTSDVVTPARMAPSVVVGRISRALSILFWHEKTQAKIECFEGICLRSTASYLSCFGRDRKFVSDFIGHWGLRLVDKNDYFGLNKNNQGTKEAT